MSAIGNPIPGPRGPHALKSKRNRQLLIYGGVGVALLLLLMLARRGQTAATASPDDASSLVPVSSPTLGSGGGGDFGSSSAQPDWSGLLNQIPGEISSGIAAGFANMPAQGGGISADDWATIATTAGGLITTGASMGGQQVGGGAPTTGGSAAAKGTKAAVHPAAPAIGQAQLVKPAKGSSPAVYVNTSHNTNAGNRFTVQKRKVGGKWHTVHVYANGHVVDMGPA